MAAASSARGSGGGRRPVGDHLGVGAGQDGAGGVDAQGGGGAGVDRPHVQGERGVEGGAGVGPGSGAGAGEQGEALAEEVEGGAAVAVGPGQPGVAETAVQVLGQRLRAGRFPAFQGRPGGAAGADLRHSAS